MNKSQISNCQRKELKISKGERVMTPNACEDVEKLNHSYIVGMNVKW